MPYEIITTDVILEKKYICLLTARADAPGLHKTETYTLWKVLKPSWIDFRYFLSQGSLYRSSI